MVRPGESLSFLAMTDQAKLIWATKPSCRYLGDAGPNLCQDGSERISGTHLSAK